MLIGLIIAAVIVVALLVFVIQRSVRAHQQHAFAGREELIGKTAVVKVALDPKGVVLVEGERWTATADSGRVEPEAEVIITQVSGLKLYVTRKQ